MTRRELLGAAGCALMADLTFSDAPPELAQILQTVRDKHGLPALAGAVILDGRLKHAAAVGIRKHGESTPVTAHDRFHLGSCTKAMTATLVAMLVERRKLDWTSRLDSLFPELGDAIHPDLRAVTVDHLLAHRSGISPQLHPRPSSLAALSDSYRSHEASRRERAAFVETVLRAKPENEPGTTYLYCNAGYVVLGAIVERLMDAPWEELMRRHIFRPLGMRTGGFGAMGRPGKVEQPWQHRVRDGEPVPVEPGIFADNPPALGPAGTAHCSVSDWARYLAATILGETERGHILTPATWQRLHTPQFGGNYAGGWLVTERSWGGRVLTHAGSNTMSFCVAWLAPDRRFGIAVMTNIAGEKTALACDEAASRMVQAYAPSPPK